MTERLIILQQKPLFWLGDKFYKVEESTLNHGRTSKMEFSSKCPSCNDTRKITYKGYNGNDFECECPVCKGSVGHGYGNKIILTNWELHEYIVYKINAQGPETVSAYKNGIGYIDSMSLTAFCKTGRCMDDYIQTNVPCVENHVDVDVSSIDMSAHYFDPKNYVFRKKANAARFLEALKERDKQRLAEFNKTYETGYEYPF
jgi:hypothetical protein